MILLLPTLSATFLGFLALFFFILMLFSSALLICLKSKTLESRYFNKLYMAGISSKNLNIKRVIANCFETFKHEVENVSIEFISTKNKRIRSSIEDSIFFK